jgi:heme-degrading monooxygenase HmoA
MAGAAAALARTPEPPYYAVIFTSLRTQDDSGVDNGYGDMSALMLTLAAQQDGYLGVESARSALGITVSYWRDLDAIKTWKRHVDHAAAQKRGREEWYSAYRVRISKVEREYGM